MKSSNAQPIISQSDVADDPVVGDPSGEPSRRRVDALRGHRPMRLYYFAPFDIQVARVDRQCVVGFCEGLHRTGVDVELVAMRIALRDVEVQAENPLSLYKIRDWFPVHIVDVPVHQDSGTFRIAFNRLRIQIARAFEVARRRDPDRQLVFFTKNYSIAAALLAVRTVAREKPIIVFEAHMPPGNAFQTSVLKRMDRIVANSLRLGRELVAGGFAEARNVLGIHQGVNLDIVDESRIARDDARRKLGLPVDKQLVVYTGKIYDGYKEVEYIVEAARLLQARDVEFILVGGREDHNERLRRRVAEMGLDNVTFAGFVAPLLVQDYQFAADILVMYYPSDMELNRYRSPGKLFDYMASGRPIVSGDLTCVREVLGDEDPAALLIPEDSPEELARAIAALLDDPERAARLAENALERVRDYTWDARADRIIAFINEVAE
jgi:glycosyltransferase involved in cell wall biosynthesis